MYTKKDFEMVAEMLRHQMINPLWTTEQKEVVNALAVKFSNRFAESNPQFNREKFLNACGVK